jgi:hypothetical protein
MSVAMQIRNTGGYFICSFPRSELLPFAEWSPRNPTVLPMPDFVSDLVAGGQAVQSLEEMT